MLPLIISYNYEIVYHRQKERESLKSPSLAVLTGFLVFYISLWHTFLQNPSTITLYLVSLFNCKHPYFYIFVPRGTFCFIKKTLSNDTSNHILEINNNNIHEI